MKTLSSTEHLGCSHLIVTRPRAQLAGLIERLAKRFAAEKLDCDILGLPLLEIEPLGDHVLAKELMDSLSSSDLIVFISPNAVISAKELLTANRFEWPAESRVAVVGGGTEQSLKDLGLKPKELIKPADTSSWDSEGLWEALAATNITWSGKRVTVVKGQGGRHWLMDQFTQHGAEVIAFEVYRRTPLSIADPAWGSVVELYQSRSQQAAWLLTSSEAVYQIPGSLEKLGVSIDCLKNSKAICSHSRIKQAAQEIGFGDVKLCEAGDLNLAEAAITLIKGPKA